VNTHDSSYLDLYVLKAVESQGASLGKKHKLH
jgi:hypothetical protein